MDTNNFEVGEREQAFLERRETAADENSNFIKGYAAEGVWEMARQIAALRDDLARYDAMRPMR